MTSASEKRARTSDQSANTPLRAADALHLALALSARAASMAAFDLRFAAAARAVGLAVYPG